MVPFLTIENKPLTTHSFQYLFDSDFIRLVVIGQKRDDCKSIKPEKLIPGAYAGIQCLIKRNRDLKNKVDNLKSENDELKSEVDELKSDLSAIKIHLGLN
jgi:hypothetical protein